MNMNEEYLEIQEVDDLRQVCDEQQIKSDKQERPQKEQQFLQLRPADFEAHCDDVMLKKLLTKFQMHFIYPLLKASDITYRSLRYLSVDDINSSIRSIGHRAEFREKLFTWRRKRYRTNDVIIEYDKSSVAQHTNEVSNGSMSNVEQQLQQNEQQVKEEAEKHCSSFSNQLTSTSSTSAAACRNLNKNQKRNASNSMDETFDAESDVNENAIEMKKAKLVESCVELRDMHLNVHLNVKELLEESLLGSVMKTFYQKHGHLERKHRDELIQIIVDYVTSNEIKLHCSDFMKITDMIVNIFPSENESRDYYFINRKGKRNPMGRLYTKYYNTLKRLRVRGSQQESATVQTTIESMSNSSGQRYKDATTNDSTNILLIDDELQELTQLDDASLKAIKSFLQCQGIRWNDVKRMWPKTYLARQQDIESLTTKDVLEEWPKYVADKGIELFDVDFRIKYPNTGDLLQKKWEHFEKKIFSYYQKNIKDETCKNLFALCKAKPSSDYEAYILIVLLNGVMLPTARYHDSSGNRRKISIAEAAELFALRLSSLNELDEKRDEILMKYGDPQNDLFPMILIVSDNYVIYVQFDSVIYEFPDFLSALDSCMKIFRVLNLPYPTGNEYTWTFIQRYFYELQFDEDSKCPLMSSLLSYLNC
uniref:Uncharacterized protein n=1 Tax=Glossina morsitans morsitans TaxID=37546 RepID=A0A1B0ERX3_GLOMM